MKKIFTGIICLLMLMLTVNIAFADTLNTFSAITFTAPASSGWVQGTYSFTGTYTGNATGNISVLYNGSKDNSVAFLCADTTVVVADSTWTCSVATSTFTEDCSGHTIYAVGYNNLTDRDNNTANGTVTAKFDNTAPTVSITLGNTQIKSKQKVAYTCTASDSCGGLTYYGNITTPITSTTYNKADDASSWKDSQTEEQGTYNAYCTVRDEATNSGTATTTFRVSGTMSVTEEAPEKAITKKIAYPQMAMLFGFGALALITVLIIVGVWFYLSSKKKRRR